jgi:ABC-type enterochelin transport system permease subunit
MILFQVSGCKPFWICTIAVEIMVEVKHHTLTPMKMIISLVAIVLNHKLIEGVHLVMS